MSQVKIFGRGPTLKYSSAGTRSTSLDVFAGNATIDSPLPVPKRLPIDGGENLMHKFQSRACLNDLPSRHGVKVVTKKLAGRFFDIDWDIQNWMRNKGEEIK